MDGAWLKTLGLVKVGLLLVACGSNAEIDGVPLADAGHDRWVGVGTRVRLDGSNSSDPEGEPLTFLWQLAARPSASKTTLRADSDPAQPSLVPDQIGYYVIALKVADAEHTSAVDVVTIEAANQPPVAVAECEEDCTVVGDTEVHLVGNASDDPDDTELTFQWQQLSNDYCLALCSDLTCDASDIPVDIANKTTPLASVKLPNVAGEQFVFELTVSDGELSDSDCLAYTTT